MRRPAPSGSETAASGSSSMPYAISSEPPPMSRTSSFPADQPNHRRAARKVSRASSSPLSTGRSTPVSALTRARTSSAFGASRTALVAKGRTSSHPLSSAACTASVITETRRSTPSGVTAPPSSSSSASRISTLCECAGCGRAPGCASTTSRWTVFEPTSRTPSLIGGNATARNARGLRKGRLGLGLCQIRRRPTRPGRRRTRARTPSMTPKRRKAPRVPQVQQVSKAPRAAGTRPWPTRRGSTSPGPGWNSPTLPTTSRSSAAT